MRNFEFKHGAEKQVQNPTDQILKSTLEIFDVPAAIQSTDYVFLAINQKYKKEFFELYGININVGDNILQVLSHLSREKGNTGYLWSRAFQGEQFNTLMEFGDVEIERRKYNISCKPFFLDQKIIGAIQLIERIENSQDNQPILKQEIDKEQIFRNSLDSMLDGVIIVHPDGRISYYNPQANRILKGVLINANRQTLIDSLVFEDEQGNRLAFEDIPSSKAYKGYYVRDKILKLFIKDNPPIWIDTSTAPIYNDQGDLFGVILNFRDVTEDLYSKEALLESESMFRTMADNISQLAWMADSKGNIFWYNKRWFDYTGTTLEQVKDWGWTKVHHPEHVNRVVNKIKHSWESGEPWEDVFPLKNKHGIYRWFLSHALPVHDSKGKIQYWFGTNTDITENKTLEEKLQNEHDLLQKIIDNIPVMISIFEPDNNVVYLNKAIEQVTGWTNDEANKFGIMNLAYPDNEYRKLISEYMQTLTTGFKNIKMTCKNGEVKDTAWANIQVSDGRRVGIGIDFTEIRNYEEELLNTNSELKKKNNKLSKLNDLLENLLYMAAHDLRAPIGNMQLMMHLIQSEETSEDKLSYLPDFQKMMYRITNVIDGLIEIIESQQDDEILFAKKVNIEQVVTDLKIELKDELKKCDGIIQTHLLTDPNVFYIVPFLQSIIKNLATNAIKYRDTSRQLVIEITVSRKDDFIILAVKDNGIGFDIVRNAKNLFRPFKRFTSTGTGTGIGLFIVKSFIEKNGGYIDVESTVGAGTTFYCYLKEYTYK